jgi:hypothetical protein
MRQRHYEKRSKMSKQKIDDGMLPGGRRAVLSHGDAAPDFSLRTTPDQWLKLSEFRGQPVILAFYPADFSPVCGDQMALYKKSFRSSAR